MRTLIVPAARTPQKWRFQAATKTRRTKKSERGFPNGKVRSFFVPWSLCGRLVGLAEHGFADFARGVENYLRHAHATVGFIDRANFRERPVAAQRKIRRPIVQSQIVGAQRNFRLPHGAPNVPRQHLHAVERREIAQQVLRDKPQTALVNESEAEASGVGAVGAAHLPCVARDHEAIARNVERVETDPESLTLDYVELPVNQ